MDAPYGKPTGIANLRVWVSRKGTKSFQLRRGDTMLTLGRFPDMPLAEAVRIATSGEDAKIDPVVTRNIGQWIDHYAEVRGHKVSTTGSAQAMRTVLQPVLRKEIGALTSSWLENGWPMLAGSYKARTRRSYQGNIVMLVNFVLDEGGLDKTPFRRLASIPVRRNIKFLDLDDVMKLERWCEDAEDHKLACFVMIGLRTGMRPARFLAWSAARLISTCLSRRSPSCRRRRRRAMSGRSQVSPQLNKFLAARLPQLPEKHPFKIGNLAARFLRMRVEGKLRKPATPHWLRHTAITHMLSRGVPINVVQEIVGHQDLTTTSLYANALRDDKHKSIKALDNMAITPLFKPKGDDWGACGDHAGLAGKVGAASPISRRPRRPGERPGEGTRVPHSQSRQLRRQWCGVPVSG